METAGMKVSEGTQVKLLCVNQDQLPPEKGGAAGRTKPASWPVGIPPSDPTNLQYTSKFGMLCGGRC